MDQTNGRLHYTSSSDGTVTITLDGDGNSDNPKTWTLKFADGSLSGKPTTKGLYIYNGKKIVILKKL